MRICNFALLLVTFLAALCGSSVAAPGNVPRYRQYITTPDSTANQELTVTVVSVDAGRRTILVEESPGAVIVTSDTVFDNNLRLDELKAGLKVRVIGIALSDGRVQASEVHAAR